MQYNNKYSCMLAFRATLISMATEVMDKESELSTCNLEQA